ncbi:glycoside hydrolase family 25 protein [Streptomyces sp. B1866]|uniref:glycoside hydrolase family 25 protein n=1 Tax=Streptomyces sp. B1866 TaxID=3075431 RepID=UPI00288E5B0C|nr:glycoside hydrolase family 25 protein [Streptomyces sp. B1866]MDT3395426.1 glycoside hydrolase family 25 protein [Streptomyces sp. B1866]
MATCRGVDVSVHQVPQDWAAHKRTGVTFAFAKASEGERSRDPRFDAHMAGIIKSQLVPGAYHFAWPNQDPAAEAANYIGAVRPYATKHPFVHWLDLERYPDGRNYAGRSAGQIRAWAAAWIAAVRTAFPGQRVGVYTSADDLAAGRVPADVPLWFPSYPWGQAPYSRAEAAARPRPSGRSPLFWQFTSQPLDRSICYLSAAELRAWAAGTTTKTKEDGMAVSDSDAEKIAAKVWDRRMDDPLKDEPASVPVEKVLHGMATRLKRVEDALAALVAAAGTEG